MAKGIPKILNWKVFCWWSSNYEGIKAGWFENLYGGFSASFLTVIFQLSLDQWPNLFNVLCNIGIVPFSLCEFALPLPLLLCLPPNPKSHPCSASLHIHLRSSSLSLSISVSLHHLSSLCHFLYLQREWISMEFLERGAHCVNAIALRADDKLEIQIYFGS